MIFWLNAIKDKAILKVESGGIRCPQRLELYSATILFLFKLYRMKQADLA